MDTTVAAKMDAIAATIDYTNDFTANVVFIICLTIMLSIGLIGNILVIGAVLVHKRLRVLGNVFVINLAVADMCVTTVVDTFGIVGVATEGTFFDNKQLLCDFVGSICVTSCACSMWNIAHISFNRYVLICHRMTYAKVYNARTVPLILAGTWIICFLIDLPNLLGWGAHSFDTRVMLCTWDNRASYTYTIFFMCTGFGIPLIVTTFSYVRIIFVVKRAESNARRGNDAVQTVSSTVQGAAAQRPKILSTDIRLLRSVFAIWVVFTVMWSPYAITVLGDVYYVWPRIIHIVGITLAHSNSSINGILYAATNRHFREGYMYLVKRCFGRGKVSPALVEMDTTMTGVKPTGRTLEEDENKN